MGLRRRVHRSATRCIGRPLFISIHSGDHNHRQAQPQGHRSERHRECSRATQHRRLRQLGGSAVRQCGSALRGWGIAPVAWPLLHCCSRPPTPLLALQLALQQLIPPPFSSAADSSARQQLPARPTAAMLMRALIPPQRRYAGFYCCYHCCQLSYSLCHDRSCHTNWPPVSLAPVSAPTPTLFLMDGAGRNRLRYKRTP